MGGNASNIISLYRSSLSLEWSEKYPNRRDPFEADKTYLFGQVDCYLIKELLPERGARYRSAPPNYQVSALGRVARDRTVSLGTGPL